MITTVLILIVAYMCDAFIRAKFIGGRYVEIAKTCQSVYEIQLTEISKNMNTVMEKVIEDKKETMKKLKALEKKGVESIREADDIWNYAVTKNLERFGLVGNFNTADLDLDAEYRICGNPMNIDIGVVKEKLHITTDQIVENMAAYIKSRPGESDIYATDDSIHDKFLVGFYLQNNFKPFLFNDKDLFDNVEIGDTVAIQYTGEFVSTVGYRLKEARAEG